MAEEVTCPSDCTAECASVADGRVIYEIDASGNLCGCGSSCKSVCGASCDGMIENNVIILVNKVLISDVHKSRYGDTDVTDGSKNRYK